MILRTVITSREELLLAYDTYCKQHGAEATPYAFIRAIFNDSVKFFVDHEALLTSLCETETIVH
ncbi:hypothetical protein D3C71_234720 [compost metagenome]